MTKGFIDERQHLKSVTGRFADRARVEGRVCIVCNWRRFEREALVCLECELRIAGQLLMLEHGVPLLSVVASSEPTSRGEANLDALDLATPGLMRILDHRTAGFVTGQAGQADDQAGHHPVARVLGWWWTQWSGRDVWAADAASLAEHLRRAVAWACRERDDVADFAGHLRQLYAAVRVALGRTTEPQHYGALCPRCRTKTLRRPSGGDWIECKGCGRLWPEAGYHELARASLQWDMEATQRLTPTEAALIAGVTRDVIDQWRRRGKLAADIGPWGGVRYSRLEIDQALAIMEHDERERARRRAERLAKLTARRVGLVAKV